MATTKAHGLKSLYRLIQNDESYRTAAMGNIFVPGMGTTENAPIVLVGEAPGKEEEKRREPFVGPAGKHLNSLLDQIHLSRERVFITNLIKYRPLTKNHGNRSPTARERRIALPYLLQELNILNPLIVVCLGLSSAKALLQQSKLTMQKANASLYAQHGLRLLVTYHPSPLNYMIAAKREAMQTAFMRLKQFIDNV